MAEDDFVEKMITCVECSTEFEFSVGEQQKFKELGFNNEPKRCKPCRAARKAAAGGGGYGGGGGGSYGGGGGQREMHDVICADCGNPAKVPFKPSGDRPVYCSDCFSRHRD